MPKFLIQASFTTEGVSGLLKEGASGRRQAIEQAVKSVGGKLESLHYALGDVDTFLIVDLPDAIAAASLSLAVASKGAVQLSTTALLTVEEVDQACKKTVKYRAPGE